MSNPIKSKFFSFIYIFLFFSVSLLSKEESIEVNNYEFGFRLGLGYKSKDRFDENLQNFRTFDSPNVFTALSTSRIKNLSNGEIIFRRRWSKDIKFGFAYGFNDYNKFSMTEISSDGYYTHLNFHLSTNYFVLTYHTEWIFRSFFLEAGIGIGINQTSWTTSGFAMSSSEYQNQKGYLSGSGIQYKAEGSFNKKVSDTVIVQIGLSFNYSTVPSFSGSLNGDSASYFITRDGKITSFGQSEYSDNYLWYNSATRRLDFSVGSAVLYFSVIGRFSI